MPTGSSGASVRLSDELVLIPTGATRLEGTLTVPENAEGVVLFAHGSGSSRFSPRNQAVARWLAHSGLATLLIDLLSSDEDRKPDARFDIDRMAHRLKAATLWLRGHPTTASLGIGYFGASTGAAVALRAAADFGDLVRAIVCRGGRPDLATEALGRVRAATLLIVGSQDTIVVGLNHKAMSRLSVPKHLAIIPGATHLFEEPGALEHVAEEAVAWFKRYLGGNRSETRSRGNP